MLEFYVTQLQTKIINSSDKEEIAYAVTTTIPHSPLCQFVRVISQDKLIEFLEFFTAKKTDEEKYRAFQYPKNAEGSMSLTKVDENKWHSHSHVHIYKMENNSNYRHVGMALHEFAFRYSLMIGTKGRIKEEAAFSSHCFHIACGFSPGSYKDSTNARIEKEKKLLQQIEDLRKTQGEAKHIDTSSLGGIPMYLCEEQILLKMKEFGITKAEEAISKNNYVTAEAFLKLAAIPPKEEKEIKQSAALKPLSPNKCTQNKASITPALLKFLSTTTKQQHEQTNAVSSRIASTLSQ